MNTKQLIAEKNAAERKASKALTAVATKQSAILTESIEQFLKEACELQTPEVKALYNKFNTAWKERARNVNVAHGFPVCSPESFDYYIKTNAYKNIITKPLPIIVKAEVLRIIKIVEGKSEFAWKARSAGYKFLFIVARVNVFIKATVDKLNKTKPAEAPAK